MSTDPDLERRLAHHLQSAEQQLTSPGTPLDEVRQRGQHLRRRRHAVQVAGALAGVGAMVLAVSLVAGNLRGGNDELTVGSPQADDTTAIEAPVDTTAGPDGAAVEPTESGASPVPVPVRPAPAGWTSDEIAADRYTEHLVVWGDGIARVTTEWSDQPIEPLPDDMVALFPEEVREFFADGLPATVDAGHQMLLERPELLDEVERVLEEHPEVAEHLYGGMSTPTFIIETTTDGRTWTPAGELGIPGGRDGWVQFVMSSGDRLVAVLQEWPDIGDAEPRTVVASSTDLTTWDTVEPLEPANSEPPPTGFRSDRWVQEADLGPDGTLVVMMSDDISLDIESVLPAELLERTSDGYGSYTTDEGVVLSFGEHPSITEEEVDMRTTVPPADAEEILLTWDELGIDPESARDAEYSRAVLMWRGSIGALQPMASPPVDGWVRGVAALADGGVLTTAVDDAGRSVVWFSPDGETWLDRGPPIAPMSWVHSIGQVADGIVLAANAPRGPSWWRADATAQGWIESPPIGLDGLDGLDAGTSHTALQDWHSGVGHVVVIQIEQTLGLDWSIEADGYRYESSFGPWPGARLVRLGVDGTPDEVILDLAGDDEDLVDVLIWDDDGITLRDPGTGEPLVSFGNDAITEAMEELIDDDDPFLVDPTVVIVLLDPHGTGEAWYELDRFTGENAWPNQLVLADGLVLVAFDGEDGSTLRSYRLGAG